MTFGFVSVLAGCLDGCVEDEWVEEELFVGGSLVALIMAWFLWWCG